MRYKKLGNTGLLVSELSLGAMTFGGVGRFENIGRLQQDGVDEIVHRSVEAGINLIDTANMYSDGVSETLLGQSIKNLNLKRDSLVLATKVKAKMGPGPNDEGLSRKHIFAQVRASLQRLQTDYIDLYQIHGPDPVTPIEETLEALNDLVRSGLVRYLGCSNLFAWEIVKARLLSKASHWAGFECLQAYYSVAGRDLEKEIVPALEDQKMGLLVWSPLAGGLLTGKYRRDQEKPEDSRRANFDFPPVNKEYAYTVIDAMDKVSKARGVSIAQIALAWLLAKPVVTSVIIGAKNLTQLNDNLAVTSLLLSREELQALDEASALPLIYPEWMGMFNADRIAFLK
ncbi:MAG TPA: aldo/keto reductase [Puia sp.]|nr:aldo/keto reductase [Puia sp.]